MTPTVEFHIMLYYEFPKDTLMGQCQERLGMGPGVVLVNTWPLHPLIYLPSAPRGDHGRKLWAMAATASE